MAIASIVFIAATVTATALLGFHPKTKADPERTVADAAPVVADAFLKESSRRATPQFLNTAVIDEQTSTPEASSAPVAEARPTPSPEASPAPSPEASPAPAPEASPAPAPDANPTPATEVSRTAEVAASAPSPVSSRQEPATPGEKDSASGVATLMARQDSDTTKDAVIKRINVLPAANAEKKAKLIEKMNKARSIQRLAVIPFDSGQTALPRAAARELMKTFCSAEIRDKLSDPTTVLVVAGYADSAGRQETNLRISQQRAENVGKILREQAKVLNAIQTVAMGGTEVLDNTRPDQNRAVEIWAVVPL